MIYTFAHKQATNVTAVGGKAAILAQLYQQNFPVPDGIVISTDAFNNDGLKNEAWTSVLEQVNRLQRGNDHTPLAVRSSALSEDSAHASFAGEYETVLNVNTDEEIQQAIQTVYDSQFSRRVTAYREAVQHESSQDDRKPAIGIVIQKMVNAELAGVLFTSDPVTGNHNLMVGNFVRGLGEQLVSGEVNAETFTLARPSGRYEGPPELKKVSKKLFKMANNLAKLLKGPQDIEWAVVKDKIFLLQSRAITTLQGYNPVTGIYNDSLRGDYIWSSLVTSDAFPDVMTPFTWSLIQIHFNEILPLTVPNNYSDFGNIGGRFYWNISITVAMMQARGFSRERIGNEIEWVFGHVPIDINNPKVSFSRWEILRKNSQHVLPIIPRIRRKLSTNLPKSTGENLLRIEQFQNEIQSEISPEALAALWVNSLKSFFCLESRMQDAITIRYYVANQSLHKTIKDKTDDTVAHTLLSSISTDNSQLASLDPIVGLWQIKNGKMSRKAYIQKFGHRGPHETETYFPPPAEDPAWIDEQLANLDGIDVPALLAAQETKRKDAWEQFYKQFPKEAEKLQPQIAQVAEYARDREISRSDQIILFGLMRKFVLRAGELTGLGDGAFFLSIEELIRVLNGEPKTAVSEIPARRQAYETLCTLPPYPVIINGRFDPITWAADPNRRSDIFDAHPKQTDITPSDDESIITGFPGSSGVVEGVVRVLHNLEESDQMQPDEILVTVTTNIGWTPVFPKVTAVITDVGAPLSHAAIVARELGIPAVVGCGNATMRLHTGDRVRVDGGQGVITIL